MLATHLVNFRKGMDGLALVLRESLGANPFSGTVYAFRSKRADRLKLLFFDGTGVVLVAKRLEAGAFRWPKPAGTVIQLTAAEMRRCSATALQQRNRLSLELGRKLLSRFRYQTPSSPARSISEVCAKQEEDQGTDFPVPCTADH